MGIFCVLMFLFGGWLVVFLYGNKYAGNGFIVGVLALSQLASALTFPINYGLNALERPDVGFKSYLLALGVTLTIGLWLVKSLGTIGVACGLLSGNILASAFRYITLRKHLGTLSAD
jgi:O-antigen/teichoic acid export membrane protein